MAFYRKYTEGMLRRYLRMSMEAGTVPSMLGRDLFRARVTTYEVRSFEDSVIFVCDVERCLETLGEQERGLIVRLAIEEHPRADVARMYAMSERSVMRRYNEAVDELTAVFLERGLLCQAQMSC